MQVNNINTVAFTGKTAYTDSGNEYKKSNEGKKYIPVAVAALGGTGVAVQCKMDKNYLKMMEKDLKLITGKMPKGPMTAALAATGLITAGYLVGIGSIFDAIINSKRRKDADKFADTHEAPKQTNKGKKIGAAIGLGASCLSVALNTVAEKSISAVKQEAAKNLLSDMHYPLPTSGLLELGKTSLAKKLAIIPMATAAWVAYGAIIDHGINKPRGEMAQKQAKAELKAEIKDEIKQEMSSEV